MKIFVFLLALAAATPALSQTPDAPAVATSPVAEANSTVSWEFAPDFLRDQNRIIWRIPTSGDATDFFIATVADNGVPKNEIINFLDASGKTLETNKTMFPKHSQLDMRDIAKNQSFVTQTGLSQKDEIVPLSVAGSPISLQMVIVKGLLAKRTFTFDFPQFKGILVCDYDERRRRTRDVFTANGAVRTINYIYDTKGLSRITDGATTSTVERDANGKMRALSATQNGLLTRSATPIKDSKGAIIGTRSEDYSGGILREVNEWTQQGGAKSSRTSQNSSDTTTFTNGQQINERKFEFRLDIDGPRAPAVAAIESRKREVYKNGKIAIEELFRNGVLTRRSQFNDNGVIENATTYDADGKVTLIGDLRKIPNFHVDGGK